MKKSAALFLLLLPISLSAQEKSSTIDTKIDRVTVFINGAQITRTGNFSYKAGNDQYLITDLPSQINSQSIQVEGKGNFVIQSVYHQINYLKTQQKTAEILVLQDSLELLQNKVNVNNVTLDVYKEEENLLKANEKLGGTQSGIKAEDIRQAADLFRSRLTEIKTKTLTIQQSNKKLNEKIQQINNQLNNLRNANNAPVSDVYISISSTQAGQGQVTLSYVVQTAGWTPVYDVRAVDINSNIDLAYKAKVYQSTGELWKNVKLTISTGNPVLGGTQPTLNPWYLSFYEPVVRMLKSKAAGISTNAPEERMAMDEIAVTGYATSKKSSDFTSTQVNQTTTEFSIALPYTIPPDGQQYTVEMTTNSLKATYEYFAVPKIDKDAFLLAHITGWEELNLMPGDVSIYFEGKYTGTSYLNTNNVNDTLDISLGRDKAIVITRTRMKDFTSKQFIGAQKKDTRSFEISVRNTKKQAIQLTLEDQVPVSTNKDIEVETLDISGGQQNMNTGKITWKLNMAPAEQKKLKLAYSVKYPKDKTVQLE